MTLLTALAGEFLHRSIATDFSRYRIGMPAHRRLKLAISASPNTAQLQQIIFSLRLPALVASSWRASLSKPPGCSGAHRAKKVTVAVGELALDFLRLLFVGCDKMNRVNRSCFCDESTGNPRQALALARMNARTATDLLGKQAAILVGRNGITQSIDGSSKPSTQSMALQTRVVSPLRKRFSTPRGHDSRHPHARLQSRAPGKERRSARKERRAAETQDSCDERNLGDDIGDLLQVGLDRVAQLLRVIITGHIRTPERSIRSGMVRTRILARYPALTRSTRPAS